MPEPIVKSDKVNMIASMYEDSFQFLQNRKMRQANQLKLLVNMNKGEQTIGSTLLITLFMRVMASVYDDKLQIKFLPSQGIIQDQINAYNMLAQSDYIEMNKAKLDYDWVWDTLFYGRGYCETLRFNKKRKIMEPHVINPLVFGYDPVTSEPQDWRYYWKWITKNKWEINKLIKNGTITGIKSVNELPSGVDEYIWQYKQIVDQARDGVEPPPDPGTRDVFQILEFFYYNDEGKKSVCWLDKNFSVVLMEETLDLDDDGDGDSKWPIVVKESYRQPHSSIPFSIADLLDDKHRADAVLLNLMYIAAKDTANPVYLYNPDKVTDVAQFLARQINQHIPVNDVVDAVAPLNKAQIMTPDMLNFQSKIMSEANDPIGTGLVGQPRQDAGSDTATEAAITQQMNDLAQSIFSKVMQFGEQEFWSHWFHRYAKNADSLGTKMANIVGIKGVDTTEIDMKLFNTDFPPGVMVYSAKEAEYKNLVKRRDMMQLYPVLAETMDEDGMRNFQKHVFWPLMLEDPSLIDIMYPKTIDEMKAEAENEQLKKNEMVDVAETDDHTTHIYMHNMVQPKTWAVWYHLAWHQELLAEQKKQEMDMAKQEMMGAPPGALGGKGKVGKEKQNPKAQASPLKTEIKNT